ncbi:lytR family transcriptional regulator domain protein [Clostridioides difficile P32]|nr:lytR family transcriptional regulator domain protein [Clostridioides difficile CD9]EQE06048.1 lytR family transcriptional regulator domain protein [Clostridioides difficile CD8]EQE18385.1 lytR family transcriptional regulator domain protein [Clostridioides difficile CD18]EQE29614.1 lytR family transcriptional regulator domain protein [Clostridioides difficile CD34]EQE38709.1 lytR family transcriptional regulator domain protein [Clostridioides difficile CD40]EQE44867.1 lytR family transcript
MLLKNIQEKEERRGTFVKIKEICYTTGFLGSNIPYKCLWIFLL